MKDISRKRHPSACSAPPLRRLDESTRKMAGTPADTPTLRSMRAPQAGGEGEASESLDSFASAAGLMQLSSAAVAADAADAGANRNAGSSSTNVVSSPADASLPTGWQRIIHGSGLPCYVHDGLGVVCWTRPYPLDVGGDGALSQPELHRLVRQHVPPLSIFTPASDAARRRKGSVGAAEAAGTASPLPALAQEPSSTQSKKRKLDNVLKERTVHAQDKTAGSGKQSSMSLEKFKTLPIGDPRVLQACMELSIKTPAQVLQEYQNRNRGVSINYNTVPVEGDGVKLFKTIVTAGSTVAEGVASTKKIAKQLGAQQLLSMLHERTAQKYYEVAEMYNSSLKGQPVISEKSTYGPAAPVRNDVRGGRGNVDPRLNRAQPNRPRRARRPSSTQEYGAGGGYQEYDQSQTQSHWSGYNQQPMQQAGPWTGGVQQGETGMDAGAERVVVYSTAPAGNAPPSYGGGQYYNSNSDVGGNAWGGYVGTNRVTPPPNLANAYPQQYSGAYGDSLPPPGTRPYGYGAYQPRSSDRPKSSTPIERVTANLRNQSKKTVSE